jgi:hypothetical protein
MDEDSVIRQIRGKGNGQAIIYVTQQDLKDLNSEIDGYVKLTKVKRTVKIKEVKT